MPNAKVKPEIQESRKAAMAPIFTYVSEHGIKQTWLARQIGVSVRSLGYYKDGLNEPPLEVVEAAWRVLGLRGKLRYRPNPKRTWKQRQRGEHGQRVGDDTAAAGGVRRGSGRASGRGGRAGGRDGERADAIAGAQKRGEADGPDLRVVRGGTGKGGSDRNKP